MKMKDTEIGKLIKNYSTENYGPTINKKLDVDVIVKESKETGFKFRALINDVIKGQSVYFFYNKKCNKIKQILFNNKDNSVTLVTFYEYCRVLNIIEDLILKLI